MSSLFGGSTKTDRGNQLAATQGLWNVYNYALPQGQQGQTQGQGLMNTANADLAQAMSSLGGPEASFNRMLTAGRTDTAAAAAPAINAELSGADAARRQEAAMGTGRTGGTAEFNREAGARTSGQVAGTVNQTQQQRQAAGAQGLLQVAGQKSQIGGVQGGLGAAELNNALNLLGLGSNADTSILNNATTSKQQSAQGQQQQGQAIAEMLMMMAMA